MSWTTYYSYVFELVTKLMQKLRSVKVFNVKYQIGEEVQRSKVSRWELFELVHLLVAVFEELFKFINGLIVNKVPLIKFSSWRSEENRSLMNLAPQVCGSCNCFLHLASLIELIVLTERNNFLGFELARNKNSGRS